MGREGVERADKEVTEVHVFVESENLGCNSGFGILSCIRIGEVGEGEGGNDALAVIVLAWTPCRQVYVRNSSSQSSKPLTVTPYRVVGVLHRFPAVRHGQSSRGSRV